MSDDLDQHDELGRPRRRSSAGPWIVGCSLGCLIFTLGLAALAFFGWRWGTAKIEEATAGLSDPEKAWPGLAEILPVAARPTSSSLVGMSTPWVSFYRLEQPELGLAGTFVLGTPDAGEDMLAWAMREAKHEPSWELETAEIEIQGRAAHSARPVLVDGARAAQAAGVPALLAIDLGRRGSRQLVVVLERPAGDDRGAATSISVEQARSFLAPFDVWRQR